MRFLGIDPGLDGALALVGDGYLAVTDMPTVGANKNRVINPLALADIISGWNPTHAIIERVHAMPKQGVASTLKFGHTLGRIDAVVLLKDVPVHWVPPAIWKKHFRLGRYKEDARRLAVERFPHIADRLSRKKDEGRAEALLIASYFLETRSQTHGQSLKADERQMSLPLFNR